VSDLHADASSGRLKGFASELRAYCGSGGAALAALESHFARRRGRLVSCQASAEQDVERCSEAYDAADDDDRDEMAGRLSAAQERLSTIRFWVRQVEEAHRQFVRDATRFDAVLEHRLPSAVRFVDEKVSRLDEYAALTVDPGDSSAPFAPSGSDADVHTPLPAEEGVSAHAELTDYRLPDGFQWVPLSSIDGEVMADLPDVSQFDKVGYDTMRAGCETLRHEILPRLQSTSRHGAERFREMDGAAGVSYEHGRQRVYEAFFGQQDFIYLVKDRRTGSFDLINGRHRVRVMNDLGWDVVPAKVKE
jgi:hypothetical protein